jgi:oxygen-dependent protoporphyrinogen oxidase
MNERVGTLVVGAGISGLAYAHARDDADLALLEASDRAGGLIRTEVAGARGEIRVECGPETLRVERGGELERMLRELGLELRSPTRAAAKRFVAWGGRLQEVPLAPPKLLASRLLTLRGKLRLLSEPWRDPRRALDGSIADFVRHRLGSEVLERLVDPFVSGIHAGDPEALSLRACFPKLAEGVEHHGSLLRALRAERGAPVPMLGKVPGGNASLVEALAARLGGRLLRSTPAEALELDGATWRVRTPSGSIEAPRLVLALPCAAAARLLARAAPELARAVASIQSESVASVALAFRREDVAHALDGFGYLAASAERLAHLGVLFSSSLDASCCPPGQVLVRALAGGARRPAVLEWSDEQLVECIAREAGPLLGLRAPPLLAVVRRWRSALPRFDLQHPERLASIERVTPGGLTLLGNYLRGIGVHHLVDAARRSARTHASDSPAATAVRSSI